MLMIASSYTMLVSSFRLNNDNWLDEQAYLASKSAVDIVASQFCEGTNEAEELYEFYVLNNCRGFQIHNFNADFQQDFKTEVELALMLMGIGGGDNKTLEAEYTRAKEAFANEIRQNKAGPLRINNTNKRWW